MATASFLAESADARCKWPGLQETGFFGLFAGVFLVVGAEELVAHMTRVAVAVAQGQDET